MADGTREESENNRADAGKDADGGEKYDGDGEGQIRS